MSRANSSVWRLLTLPCDGMSRLASESLDRDLGRLERLALRTHQLSCRGCRRYARQVAFLRAALNRMPALAESTEGLPGPAMPDELRARIEQSLRDEI